MAGVTVHFIVGLAFILSKVKWALSNPIGSNVYIAESVGFEWALKTAEPGDRLILPRGFYPGTFIATVNGTEDNPIEISGSDNKARILGIGNGKNPGLIIIGNYWKVSNLNISNDGGIGLLVTGDNFVGTGISVIAAATGVVLSGEDDKLVNSTVINSGTGILVDGARNVDVSGNKVSDAEVCISVTSDSQNGVLDSNQCGLGSVKNDGTVLEKNTVLAQ